MSTNEARQRRARIKASSQDRIAFITGKIDHLPPVQLDPPKQEDNTNNNNTNTNSNNDDNNQIPQATHGKKIIENITYFLCLVVSLLLAANSIGIFPHNDGILGDYRRRITYSYIGTLLLTCTLAHRKLLTSLWQFTLTCFFWLLWVQCAYVVLVPNYKLSDSNFAWIFAATFFFEFLIVALKSNQFIKKLLVLVSSPTMWMAHLCLRMILTTILVISFPDLGNFILLDLRNYAHAGLGVALSAWLSMIVCSYFSGKLLL